MEESNQQRHIQKEEFRHNPGESAIVSFLGNDPQTNKKWIQYNSSQIRHGHYVSNGAIARGTVPESYQSTDSTQTVIDWKISESLPLPGTESLEDNSELTTYPIFLVKSTVTKKEPIFLVKSTVTKKEPIFLVKKTVTKKEPIFLVKKSSLKIAYVALLELQTEYVYIYNPLFHSCDRVPISEIITGEKTYADHYADYEECRDDNLHCTGGGAHNYDDSSSDGIDPSIKIADSIAANHEGWIFTFYFGYSVRVKEMVNPASIWYNGWLTWGISRIHSGGQPGEPIDAPPNTSSKTYEVSGNKYKSDIESHRVSEGESLPCPEIPNNIREYTSSSGFRLTVKGGSKNAVLDLIKSRPAFDSSGGDGAYKCVNHGYFYSNHKMAAVGAKTQTKVFPYTMTGYLAEIRTKNYNKPGTNKIFFPERGGGSVDDYFYSYSYCGNPPIERKDLWLEYSLLFEGKRFDTGVTVLSDDTAIKNSHKFVIGVGQTDIFFRIWTDLVKQKPRYRYSKMITFYLDKTTLAVNKKLEQILNFNEQDEEILIDYRFFNYLIQVNEIRYIYGTVERRAVTVLYSEFTRDIWSPAFQKLDLNKTYVPYNASYGYYSGNLIKGSLDSNEINNPDVIVDVFYVNPESTVGNKSLKEHILKSDQDALNVNLIVTITQYRRLEISPKNFFVLKKTKIEKIVNLMKGFNIPDSSSKIAKVAGVIVYV